jgi:carboxylesterase type B
VLFVGLFSKAITQSGTALCPWALVDDPEKTLLNFVTNLGCDGDLTTESIVTCLKDKPAAELARESVNSNKVFAKVFIRVEAKVPGGGTMNIVI